MDDLLKALQRLKVETGSLACMGCGHENSCSTRGCAILRAAIEKLEIPADENARVKRIKNQRYEINCLKNKIKKLMRRIESLERRKIPEPPRWHGVDEHIPDKGMQPIGYFGGGKYDQLRWFDFIDVLSNGAAVAASKEREVFNEHLIAWYPCPEPPMEVPDGH